MFNSKKPPQADRFSSGLQPLRGKTIITTILILTLSSILLMGCQDNINSIDQNTFQIEPNDIARSSLIWSCNTMEIRANGEWIVSLDSIYSKGDNNITNIRITFDGYTNADTSTYVSQVSIHGDGNCIFLETGEQYINRYHSLNFNIAEYNQIRIYIALWCDGYEGYCSTAVLKLANLRIYKIN